MNTDQLLEQLKWRYAVKKFDNTRKVSEKDWAALEQSLILTPSSYGLQPWKFLVIQNPEVRKQLTPASWNQTQIADCSHLVVFAAKKELDEKYIDAFIEDTARTRNLPKETFATYQKMMTSDLIQGPRSKTLAHWATNQTYIAIGNLMTCAAILGIDTCPLEGIDPTQYDQILKLEGTGYATRVACAVGYRSLEDKYAKAAKVRFMPSQVVLHI